MELQALDIATFVVFIGTVIVVSLYASRKEETSADYFLAGRGLTWPFIGLSLIAANISTEHFVGMAGTSYGNMGLAVASYEWIAAITLVVVAMFLLPKFLRAGIYTIPEFLEYRYGPPARALMATYMMIMYVGVAIASVLYSGGIALVTIFDMNLTAAVLLIGFLAAAYTIYGGLKSVVTADLFLGSALIIGGFITMVLGFRATGGVEAFMQANADKLHMVLPANHPEIPYTALFCGIWIPNLFYWGLNQFITQRTLGAKNLAEGQKGIMLAATLKLTIPFIIVMPGIMAYQLYHDEISQMALGRSVTASDQAYPYLIRHLLPGGLRGFMFTALVGAVMSSLASMLNSASTIFTMDLYKRHFHPEASQRSIVIMGRITTTLFVIIGCIIAPLLANPNIGGIFKYIQKFQGFISPGIVTVFFFGLFVSRRAPMAAAIAAMLLNIVVYGALLWFLPHVAFLNHMAITFAILFVVMAIITVLMPLEKPVVFPVNESFDMRASRFARIWGVIVIVVAVGLYLKFW